MNKTRRKITSVQLRKLNACRAQVREFEKRFGAETIVTVAKARKVAAIFDWDWLGRHALSAPAWDAYKKATATACDAYEKATAPAWDVYEKATAPAWDAYEKAKATAWDAYEKAKATAWDAYEKAKATAWATAYINDKEPLK